MFRSRPKRPKRPIGENPVLRRRYEQEHDLPNGILDGHYHVGEVPAKVHLDYRNWLRDHGIDPATGRMTEGGFAFLKECLDRERLLKPPQPKTSRNVPP